jgi:hypothetical protein
MRFTFRLTLSRLVRATLGLPALLALALPAGAQGTTVRYPLKLSPDRTHLLDQDNRPFFINGDVGWSIIVNTTRAEATQYLENRAAKGYNAIWVGLIDRRFSENAPNNVFNDPPFTTSGNFATPNESYFAHADWVLSECNRLGIVAFLTPLYLGSGCGGDGWCQEIRTNSVATMRGYGEYIGNRYRNHPNIVWVLGGDADPVAEGVENKVIAVKDGIRARDSVHLMTAHNFQQSAIDPAWADNSWIDLNTVYTYGYSHEATLAQYNKDPRPIFFQETRFEREQGASDLEIRRQAWWAVLSGARLGHFFGNCPLWGFDHVQQYCTGGTPWTSQLDSVLSFDLSYLGRFFKSRTFTRLVPDQAGSVLTVGVQSGETKATAARATDGSSVIVYLPTRRQVTVDLASVGGAQGHGWWFNPRDATTIDLGTFQNTGSRSFTPPDGNDWVLVIDNASLNFPAPGTGTGGGTGTGAPRAPTNVRVVIG